jgi:general secretion pathway protein M
MVFSLHSLSPSAASAWERASSRERRLVTLAALVIVFAVAWAWLWQPMQSDVARLTRDLPRLKASLAAARAQANALVALQQTTALAKRSDPRVAVERVLVERNLRPSVTSLDVVDGRVRLTFAAVRFDALIGLLGALAKSEGLTAVDAVLTARVEPGTVRAEVALAR